MPNDANDQMTIVYCDRNDCQRNMRTGMVQPYPWRGGTSSRSLLPAHGGCAVPSLDEVQSTTYQEVFGESSCAGPTPRDSRN
jgi:hypothetical protein